ncbi:MAG: hypothetical protein WC082_12295, partial [Victivallales bacterium]
EIDIAAADNLFCDPFEYVFRNSVEENSESVDCRRRKENSGISKDEPYLYGICMRDYIPRHIGFVRHIGPSER